MQYEDDNQTRLQKAKELAGWLVDQLPAETPGDGCRPRRPATRAGIESRRGRTTVERLELSAAVRPMDDALRDATRWLATKKDYRGEMYVFTDLAAEAWPGETAAAFAKALDAMPGANVYLIDVGRSSRRIVGWALKISSEVCLERHAAIDDGFGNRGASRARTGETEVELFVGDGESAREAGQQSVCNSSSGANRVLALRAAAGHASRLCADRRARCPALRRRSLLHGRRAAANQGTAARAKSGRHAVSPRGACAHSGVGLRAIEVSLRGAAVQSKSADQTVGLCGRLSGRIPRRCPIQPGNRWSTSRKRAAELEYCWGERAARAIERSEAQRLLPAKLRWQSHEPTYIRPVAVEHPALRELTGLAIVLRGRSFRCSSIGNLKPGANRRKLWPISRMATRRFLSGTSAPVAC